MVMGPSGPTPPSVRGCRMKNAYLKMSTQWNVSSEGDDEYIALQAYPRSMSNFNSIGDHRRTRRMSAEQRIPRIQVKRRPRR